MTLSGPELRVWTVNGRLLASCSVTAMRRGASPTCAVSTDCPDWQVWFGGGKGVGGGRAVGMRVVFGLLLLLLLFVLLLLLFVLLFSSLFLCHLVWCWWRHAFLLAAAHPPPAFNVCTSVVIPCAPAFLPNQVPVPLLFLRASVLSWEASCRCRCPLYYDGDRTFRLYTAPPLFFREVSCHTHPYRSHLGQITI